MNSRWVLKRPRKKEPRNKIFPVAHSEDTMQLKHVLVMAVAMAFTASDIALGLDIFVYPGKGQTKEQQEQDEFACYKWAKDQTGVDPTQPVQQAAAAPPPGREVGRGAARGAAVGAIGGAIGGDAGKGAAIGAGVGAAAGVARRRQAEQQQQAAQQQARQQQEASINGYKRAFSACMTARGYTVS
jgi:hypothetical protein